jgi:CBS domain containing-hemolysin-like protein
MDGLLLTAVLPLAAFVLLTAGNAFFVVAEFGLVTVDRAEIDQRADSGDRRARTVRHALHELSFQLSGAQLGITITALLTGYLAEPALSRLFTPLVEPVAGGATETVTYALSLILATLVSMLFGELVPKNAALARPMRAALATAAPLRTFSRIFRGPIGGLNGSANFLVRRLGIEPQEELASARSPEELGLLAAISARAGAQELTAPGGGKTILVDGLLREDEVAEQTGFRLPEGPYETLAGFLLARLGHIPSPGESLEENGWEFTVMEVDRHRIEQVRVVAPPPEPLDG